MLAKGISCAVELHEHHIVLRREGLINAMNGLGGEKSIPLANITSVQFRTAGIFVPGFIWFSVMGEIKPQQRERDPNFVQFSGGQAAAFQKLREAIERTIHIPSLAALASQHVRGRAIEADAQVERPVEGRPLRRSAASAPLLEGPTGDTPLAVDSESSLVPQLSWAAWRQRLKFFLRMILLAIATAIFLGVTGIGRRLEGVDRLTLPVAGGSVEIRLAILILMLAMLTALLAPVIRLATARTFPEVAGRAKRATRYSLVTIIFALPIIVVTSGPSPNPPEVAVEPQHKIEAAGIATIAEPAAPVAINPWVGKYDGYFDGAIGTLEIAERPDRRLLISIVMAGRSCAGGIEAVVDQPKGDAMTIVKAPYEDGEYQESACRLELQRAGGDIRLHEEEACMNHHGMSCGFDGTAYRGESKARP